MPALWWGTSGRESATSASTLDGKIKCIIMQSAMAIIAQRRPASGKKVMKELTRQAPFYRTADRWLCLERTAQFMVAATPQDVTGILSLDAFLTCGSTCMTCTSGY